MRLLLLHRQSSDTGKQLGGKIKASGFVIPVNQSGDQYTLARMLLLYSLIPALRPSGLEQSLNAACYLLRAPTDIVVWEMITMQLRLMFTPLVLSS